MHQTMDATASNSTLVTLEVGTVMGKSIISHGLNVVIGSGLEVLGFAGIVSIILLLIVIFKFRHVKAEASFIIIGSLAIADCGHLLVVAGHVGPELLMREISWGNLLEGSVSHANLVFWYASVGNYNLMALNRFCAVCRPLKQGKIFSNRRTFMYCCFTWLFALLLSLAPLTGFCCRKIFDIHWDENEQELGNHWDNHLKIITIVFNWCTVIVMSACYVMVFRKLRGRVVPEARNSGQQRQQRKTEKRIRNVCYQFLLISVIFTMLLCFQVATQVGWTNKPVITTLQFLYATNSGINPIIYLAFNKTLRYEMIDTALCKKGKYIAAHVVVTGPGTAMRTVNRSEWRRRDAQTGPAPKSCNAAQKLEATKNDAGPDAITPVD